MPNPIAALAAARLAGIGLASAGLLVAASVTAVAAPTISAVTTGVSWVQGTGSPITTGESPRRVVVSPDGSTAYLIATDSNLVQAIDTATNTVIDDLAVVSPLGIEISPDGSALYVLNYGADDISVISTATFSLVDAFPIDADTYGIELSADGSTLFTVSGATVRPWSVDGVALHPAINPGVGGSITLGTAPDSATLWAAGYNGDSVPIDVASWTAGTPITTGAGPLYGSQDIKVSLDNTVVYVANALANSLVVIDVASLSVVDEVPDIKDASEIALSPDGTLVYVMAFNGGEPAGYVVVFDAATLTALDAFGTLPTPHDMTISPDGTRIYIPNEDIDRLQAFNTRTLSLSGPGEIQHGTATTEFDVSILDGRDPNGDYSDFYLRVFDANNVQVGATTLPVPASGIATMSLPTAALAPGTYSLQLFVGAEPGSLVVMVEGFIVHPVLATTGTDVTGALLVAGGMLFAGLATLALTRRRVA